ncbi:MAG: hypothetical protein PUI80_04775 [Peptoniphilaceae bacterium]|nr:hypothetical protein [Peptoniphilaceae bacterium]
MNIQTIKKNEAFLKKYIPNFDELVASGDIGLFLVYYDIAIQNYGFNNYETSDPRYGYSELGHKMQEIYDKILLENHTEAEF